MARLVGLVPALGALEVGQLGAGLADHRHALADGRQRGERVGDERAAREQRPGLRARAPSAGRRRRRAPRRSPNLRAGRHPRGHYPPRVPPRPPDRSPSCSPRSPSRRPASAAPTTPLSQEGRWIVDADGRVVLMRGVNMVYKVPPYHPGAAGFGIDDARFLAREGFNTVRLGVIYTGVEPSPGVYDEAYLDQIARDRARARERGDLLPARLPPGHVQRALPGRGLAGLGGLRRRPARRAEDRLPRQLLRDAGADPGLRQLVGERPRAPVATASRTATRRPGGTWPSASRTSRT